MFTIKLVSDKNKRIELSEWNVVRIWLRGCELFETFEQMNGTTEDVQAYLVEEYPSGDDSPTQEVKQILAVNNDESVYVTDGSGKTVYCLD